MHSTRSDILPNHKVGKSLSCKSYTLSMFMLALFLKVVGVLIFLSFQFQLTEEGEIRSYKAEFQSSLQEMSDMLENTSNTPPPAEGKKSKRKRRPKSGGAAAAGGARGDDQVAPAQDSQSTGSHQDQGQERVIPKTRRTPKKQDSRPQSHQQRQSGKL